MASAVGLVTSDLVVDRVRTRITPLDGADTADLSELYGALERSAVDELPGGSGELIVTRSADLRYRGQAHQLTVPAPPGPVTEATLSELETTFIARYRHVYGIDHRGPTELVNVRVRVVKPVEKVRPVPGTAVDHPASAARTGERKVCFAGSDFLTCPVYRWESLDPGSRLTGPAIVEGLDSTVAVPPGFGLSSDPWRNLILQSGEAAPWG